MPNWCENSLLIRGPKPSVDQAIPDQSRIDFEDLVPVGLATGQSGGDAINRQSGIWGTKWNVQDNVDIEDALLLPGEKEGEIQAIIARMDTAWGPPKEWLLEVIRAFPELEFAMTYGEPGMAFKGEIRGWAGEVEVEAEESEEVDLDDWMVEEPEAVGQPFPSLKWIERAKRSGTEESQNEFLADAEADGMPRTVAFGLLIGYAPRIHGTTLAHVLREAPSLTRRIRRGARLSEEALQVLEKRAEAALLPETVTTPSPEMDGLPDWLPESVKEAVADALRGQGEEGERKGSRIIAQRRTTEERGRLRKLLGVAVSDGTLQWTEGGFLEKARTWWQEHGKESAGSGRDAPEEVITELLVRSPATPSEVLWEVAQAPWVKDRDLIGHIALHPRASPELVAHGTALTKDVGLLERIVTETGVKTDPQVRKHLARQVSIPPQVLRIMLEEAAPEELPRFLRIAVRHENWKLVRETLEDVSTERVSELERDDLVPMLEAPDPDVRSVAVEVVGKLEQVEGKRGREGPRRRGQAP